MTSPIVHIGFHKTATSWFQACVYPHVASHRMIDRDLVRSVFMDSDAFDFDPQVARAGLGLDGDLPPPLICEEELSGVLHIGVASTYIAKEVAVRLHATLPDAQIVIFVRNQVDAALSWYLQYLKEGGTASLRRYLFPDEYVFPGRFMLFKTARFDFLQLDYAGLIKTYDSLFGREKVHVFAYEQLQTERTTLIDRMSQELDFDLAGEFPSGEINPAYRRGLLPVARALNLFSARQVVNKRTLVHLPFLYRGRWELLERLNRASIFGARPSAHSMFDLQTQRWIAQRFAASNAWLSQRMGQNLAALGYAVATSPEPVPEPRRNRFTRWMRK